MTAPGWYNDEQDPRLARWHDGGGWTEHTMVKADWSGPGDPPPPAGAAPAPAGPPLGRLDLAPPAPPWIEQPPPPRRRPPREGPSGHLVAAIASLVAILVCLLVLQRLEEDRATEASAPTTTTLPATVQEWTTVDGGTYRISITPLATQSEQPSPAGCVAAAGDDRANRQFTVRIENTSPTQAAPLPQVAFGVNVGAGGTVDPAITTLDGASTDVEVGPVTAGTPCSRARTIVAESGEPLPPAGTREFTGVVGDVPAAAPDGLALIVRWFAADAAQERRGTGFSPVDVVVAFPTGNTTTTRPG